MFVVPWSSSERSWQSTSESLCFESAGESGLFLISGVPNFEIDRQAYSGTGLLWRRHESASCALVTVIGPLLCISSQHFCAV